MTSEQLAALQRTASEGAAMIGGIKSLESALTDLGRTPQLELVFGTDLSIRVHDQTRDKCVGQMWNCMLKDLGDEVRNAILAVVQKRLDEKRAEFEALSINETA